MNWSWHTLDNVVKIIIMSSTILIAFTTECLWVIQVINHQLILNYLLKTDEAQNTKL